MISQPGNPIGMIVATANRYSTGAARMAIFIIALSCTLALTLGATAAISQDGNTASEALNFDSPEKRALYHKLTHEFRCLKCQNQNLAGSAAGLADVRGFRIVQTCFQTVNTVALDSAFCSVSYRVGICLSSIT